MYNVEAAIEFSKPVWTLSAHSPPMRTSGRTSCASIRNMLLRCTVPWVGKSFMMLQACHVMAKSILGVRPLKLVHKCHVALNLCLASS